MAESYFSLTAEDRAEVLELGRDRTGRPAHLLEKDVSDTTKSSGLPSFRLGLAAGGEIVDASRLDTSAMGAAAAVGRDSVAPGSASSRSS